MEQALGIGGVFFKARDPKALAAWYREHLGVPVAREQTYEAFMSAAAGEQAVWSAIPSDTQYFGSGPAPFMVNYRVQNLDAMLAQLRAAGTPVDVDAPNLQAAVLAGCDLVLPRSKFVKTLEDLLPKWSCP